MQRWFLLACLLAAGCDVSVNPDALKPNPPMPAAIAEPDELGEQLKAARAEVAKLKAELASRPAVDTAREQKLAIGRFIVKQQGHRFAAAVGSLSDAQLAAIKPMLTKLQQGGPIPADEYWELDVLFSQKDGPLNDRWLANVDWSTNPERKEFIDSLSLMLHSISATEYAAKLDAAAKSGDIDAYTMLVYEREIEGMGSAKESKVPLIRDPPTP